MKDLKNQVASKIKRENLIPKGNYVILGLSGGPDSVCLFDILKSLAKEQGFELCAVHVNHNLRGKDAKEDEEYVKDICLRSDVKCYTFSEDCNELAQDLGISCEEAGRKLRYESFDKVKNLLITQGISPEKVVVAVAHNMDDQAETILFRMIRGTGIDGLAGMDSKATGMFGLTLIRPLLDTSRENIENYCEEHNLNPRIDKTNNESLYSRNKIRLELLPVIKEKFNPNVVSALVKLSEASRDDKRYLWDVALKTYNEIKTVDNELKLLELKKIPRPISHRIYELILQNLGVETIEQNHLKAIDRIVYSNSENPSLAVDLPNGVKASLIYDKIIFVNKNDQGNCQNQQFKIREIDKETYEKLARQDKVHAAFDKDKLGDNIVSIRTKKDGDFIFLKNLGRKKLQDFLVDNKFPKLYRNEVLVSAIGSEVIWIMPNSHFKNQILKTKGRMSGKYNVDNNTKSVLIIEKAN